MPTFAGPRRSKPCARRSTGRARKSSSSPTSSRTTPRAGISATRYSRAVGRGVRVCVLADAYGSMATRRGFWKKMRAHGVEVRLFNPLFPHLLTQPFRDHRKILVVDGTIGFTGGMNIGDEYGSSLRKGHRGPWRDTHVRVHGPAAWGMATVFTEAWLAAGGS